ncbi:hypothetical protein [Georgenia thermotolerans]|uniref:Uncharacterized protein n=1 Tax=Georgenia thermotolerans TaxID=527326 RepID=A0A7J5UU38_9MICO|nr:hypothetical protein [Georgenia thermotolerans]KAE8765804.1 hypothetical protein GB883_01730 [Georgenia thermotolerans]
MAKWSDAASDAAVEEIRRFSRWPWVVGAVAMVLVVLAVIGQVSYDAATGRLVADPGSSAETYPWKLEDPPVVTAADGTWSGTGSALIQLDQPPGQVVPREVTVEHGRVNLSVTKAAPQLSLPARDREWPRYVDYLSPSAGPAIVVPPAQERVELWVQGEGEWALSIEDLRPQPLETAHDGTGNAVLQYTGDSLSARFVHRGNGVFTVTVHTDDGADTAIIESGDVDRRLSWDESSSVLFAIESTGEGAWTVAVDQLAAAPAATAGSPEEGTAP